MKASKVLSVTLARFIDAVAVVFATMFVMRMQESLTTPPVYYGTAMLSALVLIIVVFPMMGVYGSWRGIRTSTLLKRVFMAWSMVVLLIIACFLVFETVDALDSAWWLSWWASGLAMMLSSRILVYWLLGFMRASGVNHKHVLLVGSEQACQRVREQVQNHAYAGYEVTNTLSLSALMSALDSVSADELWLLLPFSQAQEIEAVLAKLDQCTVNVRWLPDDSSLLSVWQSPRELVGMTALDLRVSPMSEPVNVLLKAIEDKVLAALILLLISPIMVVLALGVKWSSPGPVFYRQKRHGWNGEAFEMLKFRSMVVHSEQDGQVTQATVGDARITPFGAFLRRTSLDELPQFFNVLKGDMSIVGPRPHAIAHNDYYSEQIDGYMLRHKMKPGITGWAQVNGWRGETDTLDKMQKRVEYDLWYIQHWSLWLDIKIIIMTLFKGFVHSNAR
jgi:putative colanic acid biosynthesis UDP-glucose lipid carrier transferase